MNKRQPPTSLQLDAWRGEFGDEYRNRNVADEAMISARMAMWRRILQPLTGRPLQSILEVGANIGFNLRALAKLTDCDLLALEPNAGARSRLVDDGIVAADNVFDGAASQIPLDDCSVDMAFTSGVLIHIAPDDLGKSCDEIYRVSNRYIACVEYFADSPQEIQYRGNEGLLFKRDFGEFWMDRHPDLHLVDYGFFWRRATGLDNLTWWLFAREQR